MRFYSWFAFSAVSSVQCVVTFPCLAVLRQYPVCTRHATPDEVTDGRGADLIAQQPHAEEGHEDSFHCNGLTLTTKFASKIAERAYCCGRPVPGRGNDFNVFHMETVTLDELQCKNVY
ncbi:hypothetical protein Pst134EA_007647 [Puccinia striiformis f. sp. tritici]|uniref:hypothetical protein n=1 Tax=Puccinia striiformis f. sp. tritici TaxID=168172 RepID=UPI002007C504|nr:hypothetical protein Pst134EA_007647 [Puccinia striiformis f. sp. tritici]KAH9470385.1 hypothetical protein Pst134EA_007647 [Puccinia striiformis f. sp. tritici]